MWDLAIICHHSFEFLFTLNKCRDMGTPAWYASWAPSLIQTPLAQTVKTWIFFGKKLLIKSQGPLGPLIIPSYGANLSVDDQPYNSKLWRKCRLNQTHHISEKKILS